MSQRAPRYSAYGEPITPLTDALVAPRQDRPVNQAAIIALQTLLRELWAAKLQRGWYGVITIEIEVNDGIIEKEVSITDKHTQRLRE
jgi:hypothetical protein